MRPQVLHAFNPTVPRARTSAASWGAKLGRRLRKELLDANGGTFSGTIHSRMSEPELRALCARNNVTVAAMVGDAAAFSGATVQAIATLAQHPGVLSIHGSRRVVANAQLDEEGLSAKTPPRAVPLLESEGRRSSARAHRRPSESFVAAGPTPHLGLTPVNSTTCGATLV